jgi:hypothetical protein
VNWDGMIADRWKVASFPSPQLVISLSAPVPVTGWHPVGVYYIGFEAATRPA